MSDRETTCPSLSQITLKKTVDNSTVSLFKESVAGSVGKKVTIKFVHTGFDSLIEFMSYTLDDCLIRGYSVKINDQNNDRGQVLQSSILFLTFEPVFFNRVKIKGAKSLLTATIAINTRHLPPFFGFMQRRELSSCNSGQFFPHGLG